MCKDASLTYLNELGYNVIRYPRADILPLDVLGRQRGTIARLGRLPDLTTLGGVAAPALRSDVHAANLEARRSSKLDAEAGVTVLGPYLKALGGNPQASAYFRRVKSMQFVFSDVLIDEATPAEIGAFLGRCPIDVRNLLWRSYLNGEGELFIITETLKSKTLTVAADADSQAGVAIDTGALQSAVGGNVAVSGGGKSSSLLSFNGSVPLVFGFKCLRLQVAGGRLALVNASPSAALAFSVPGAPDAARSAPPEPAEPVLLGDGLIHVRPPRAGRPSNDHDPDDQRDDAPHSLAAAEAQAREPVGESAPLPEEDSPAASITEADALIYVRLLEPGMTPRRGLTCRIRGPLDPLRGPAPVPADAEIDVSVCSDDDGVLLIDGCPPGVYELRCAVGTFNIHTLRQRDLSEDGEPYRLMLAPTT